MQEQKHTTGTTPGPNAIQRRQWRAVAKRVKEEYVALAPTEKVPLSVKSIRADQDRIIALCDSICAPALLEENQKLRELLTEARDYIDGLRLLVAPMNEHPKPFSQRYFVEKIDNALTKAGKI